MAIAYERIGRRFAAGPVIDQWPRAGGVIVPSFRAKQRDCHRVGEATELAESAVVLDERVSSGPPLPSPPPALCAEAELLNLGLLPVKSNNFHSGGLASTGGVLLARSRVNCGTTRKMMFHDNAGCPRSMDGGMKLFQFSASHLELELSKFGGMPVLCGR